MNSCGDPASTSSYRRDSFITTTAMISIHGGGNNNTTSGNAFGLPLSSSYTHADNDTLFDDYSSSSSTFSSHTLTAPPPSPQDPSPLDTLFAQHLTAKLHQAVIYSTKTSTSPPSAATTLPSKLPDSDSMDVSPVCGKASFGTEHLSPVMIPGALPLTATTTYHHHHHHNHNHSHHPQSKKSAIAVKQHGVDPQQLDLLLRRVTRNRRQYYTPHHHVQHHMYQPRLYRPAKRTGGFHKKPSKIPLYTRRLEKQDEDKSEQGNEAGEIASSSASSASSWKHNASRQKQLAISSAVEKWKKLKQYQRQGSNDSSIPLITNKETQEEMDLIVQDLKEMGL